MGGIGALFLDCALDFAQMHAQGAARVAVSLGQVTREFQLLAQGSATFDCFGLLSFALSDDARGGENLLDVVRPNEQATVVVRKNYVGRCNLAIAEPGALQSSGCARVEPLRPGWAGAIAKDRESDLAQLGRVAMKTPDNDAGEAASFRFEGGKVSDAPFIGASAVVYHENVAGLGFLHRFQEDIDASEMSHGQGGTSQVLTDKHGPNPRRGDP